MPDARENYPIFQSQLSHENDNLNQRLFWFLFSQSLLLGAYSGVLNAPETPRNPAFGAQVDVLVWLLPSVALALSAALYPMIVISLLHMRNLRRQFERQIDGDLDDMPPIHGTSALRNLGDVAYLAMPVILGAGWAVLLGRMAWPA